MKKQTHLAVDYRAGDRHRRCATCIMYRAAKAEETDPKPHCTNVEDPIRPEGVCDIYRQRG